MRLAAPAADEARHVQRGLVLALGKQGLDIVATSSLKHRSRTMIHVLWHGLPNLK